MSKKQLLKIEESSIGSEDGEPGVNIAIETPTLEAKKVVGLLLPTILYSMAQEMVAATLNLSLILIGTRRAGSTRRRCRSCAGRRLAWWNREPVATRLRSTKGKRSVELLRTSLLSHELH